MKRPQGFDRGADRASGPFAAPAPAQERAETPAREPKGQKAAPLTVVDTEPIAVVHAAKRVDNPSARTTAGDLRRARRARKRYERGEVKRFTRRTRRRRAVWLISVGSVAAIVLLAVATAFSPLMDLTKIEVVGTSRLSSSAVSHALAGQLGRPLPLIDFGAIKKRLAGFALIRSYSTETHPPGTLIVRVVERVPIGVIQTAKGFELVDAAGVTISTTAQRPGGYPIVKLSEAVGSRRSKPGFDASAAVLTALPPSVLPQVDSVTAKTTDDVTLTLRGGQQVLWGSPDQSELKAADLAALLKDAPGASGYDVSSPQSPVSQ